MCSPMAHHPPPVSDEPSDDGPAGMVTPRAPRTAYPAPRVPGHTVSLPETGTSGAFSECFRPKSDTGGAEFRVSADSSGSDDVIPAVPPHRLNDHD
ncbi:protein of unknown function (plasmid) [Streptantibioticus cattleyicolor NRRL 8057 = DSM 46488]|nr:protein of unknown function [Streptantibioticus cattleyicolor NRRL 8057 = DSM 46488]